MVDEAGILVTESIVVLPPDVRSQEIVQRRNGPPPRDVARRLQPLRMLVEHRVYDVDKGLIAGEKAMATGEKIPFEPALAHVLAEHFHHAAVGGDVVVALQDLLHRTPIGDLEDRVPTVRCGLIRGENPEIVRVQLQHVPQELALYPRGLGFHGARLRHGDCVVAEVRHAQLAQQDAAVGMRIGAHASLAGRRQIRQFGKQLPGLVEQLLRLVAPHPLLKNLDVLRAVHLAYRYLV